MDKVIEIKEEVTVGNVILEKGDRIKVLEVSFKQAMNMLKNVKSVQFEGAEGKVSEYEKFSPSPVFKNVRDAQDYIEKNLSRPDIGYNKVNTVIVFDNKPDEDFVMQGFRYDHGYKDEKFTQQLQDYLEYNVHMDEE